MANVKTVPKKRKIKRCKQDVIYDTVLFIVLTLILVIVAYPLWWVIISSFSNPTEVSAGNVIWLPIGFNLKGYAEVFKDDMIVRSFFEFHPVHGMRRSCKPGGYPSHGLRAVQR